MNNYFRDTYADTKPPGRAIATQNPAGVTRKGVDTEGVIGIDHNALRIKPLIQPGWGRSGIAYGPYHRSNGLAFAAFLVNGHNTSQMGYMDAGLKSYLITWIHGSEVDKRLRYVFLRRLLFLLTKSPDKKNILRRLIYWYKFTRRGKKLPLIRENLAVGWFPQEVPENPLAGGNGFIIHAADHENGEIWTHVGANILSALKGLQNLQIYYIVILREQGAVYYIASSANAYGLGTYPNMRPLAIDAFNKDTNLYAGIYQSAQGEIGFWVDTRVYGTQVQQLPELATWYGTAELADRLTGDGLLDDTQAEIGGLWNIYKGSFERTTNGIIPMSRDSMGVLWASTSSGLVHVTLATSHTVTTAGIVWRFQDSENFWSLLVGGEKSQLQIHEHGTCTSVAVSDEWHLEPNTTHSLQVLDAGKTFSLYLDGKLVFNTPFTDTRLENATGVGVRAIESNDCLYLRDFEAHPRSVPIPTQLDFGSPWIARGKEIVVRDDFSGNPVTDLAGTITRVGNCSWRKDMGDGIIQLTGNGSARVKASAKNPNPGRTVYTIAWENPSFADIQIDITPPGSDRGQGEQGRGGLIFWQDPENYIIINNWLDDIFAGASISSFFTINGFEDLFDAVWTNVGSRVFWGVTHQLRVVFDGMNYTAYINDEPVLYRSLRDVYPNIQRLAINRVGIAANWEWGNDTGSIFSNFVGMV